MSEQLKYISSTAVTLNTEERMQLEYALSSLQSTMQFEKLFFWGKVTGKSFASRATGAPQEAGSAWSKES